MTNYCNSYLYRLLLLLLLLVVVVVVVVFSFFFVVRHFRPSLLNNFYCNIVRLYNIVIPLINPVTSVELKKAGVASRNIFMKKQYTLF